MLKRAAEGSAFLAEEAIRATSAMIRCMSDAKSLALLLQYCAEGGKAHQTTAALFVDRACEVLGARTNLTQLKDFPRLVAAVANFVGGATADMRVYARRAAVRLCAAVGGPGQWEAALKKLQPPLTPAHFAALKKLLDKRGLEELPELPTPARAPASNPGSSSSSSAAASAATASAAAAASASVGGAAGSGLPPTPGSAPAARRRESKLRPSALQSRY